jgi:hypothetical protein
MLSIDESNQNGIFSMLIDDTGNILSGSRFFIFSSRELWQNNDSTGSTYQGTSDSYGRVLKLNVLSGTYYFRAFGLFGSVSLKAEDSSHVNQDGISRSIVQLNPYHPDSTGIICKLVDSAGSPVAGSSFYIFNSLILFQNNDTLGYIFKVQSDYLGRAIQLNMPPGNYYVNAMGVYGSLTLQALGTIMVSNDSVSRFTLEMQKTP